MWLASPARSPSVKRDWGKAETAFVFVERSIFWVSAYARITFSRNPSNRLLPSRLTDENHGSALPARINISQQPRRSQRRWGIGAGCLRGALHRPQLSGLFPQACQARAADGRLAAL